MHIIINLAFSPVRTMSGIVSVLQTEAATELTMLMEHTKQ